MKSLNHFFIDFSIYAKEEIIKKFHAYETQLEFSIDFELLLDEFISKNLGQYHYLVNTKEILRNFDENFYHIRYEIDCLYSALYLVKEQYLKLINEVKNYDLNFKNNNIDIFYVLSDMVKKNEL